ncbi:hypothetical protein [Nonomuraea sp. NPDC050202]|uniref:hypothetical protein n=1 Tax=Nonomuraea sp. NPDC050202 TaxID=3155035 RepID=UPI0033F485E3
MFTTAVKVHERADSMHDGSVPMRIDGYVISCLVGQAHPNGAARLTISDRHLATYVNAEPVLAPVVEERADEARDRSAFAVQMPKPMGDAAQQRPALGLEDHCLRGYLGGQCAGPAETDLETGSGIGARESGECDAQVGRHP